MAPTYNTTQGNDTKDNRLGRIKDKLKVFWRGLLGGWRFSRKLKGRAGIPPETHDKNKLTDGWGVKRAFSFEKDGCLWVGQEYENGSSLRGTQCLNYPQSGLEL